MFIPEEDVVDDGEVNIIISVPVCYSTVCCCLSCGVCVKEDFFLNLATDILLSDLHNSTNGVNREPEPATLCIS